MQYIDKISQSELTSLDVSSSDLAGSTEVNTDEFSLEHMKIPCQACHLMGTPYTALR